MPERDALKAVCCCSPRIDENAAAVAATPYRTGHLRAVVFPIEIGPRRCRPPLSASQGPISAAATSPCSRGCVAVRSYPAAVARLRGHCLEAARLAVPRSNGPLDQVQEPGGAGVAARGRGGLGPAEAIPLSRRFPPPWSVLEHTESFVVHDSEDQPLYF
jgi:hypothetical protein